MFASCPFGVCCWCHLDVCLLFVLCLVFCLLSMMCVPLLLFERFCLLSCWCDSLFSFRCVLLLSFLMWLRVDVFGVFCCCPSDACCRCVVCVFCVDLVVVDVGMRACCPFGGILSLSFIVCVFLSYRCVWFIVYDVYDFVVLFGVSVLVVPFGLSWCYIVVGCVVRFVCVVVATVCVLRCCPLCVLICCPFGVRIVVVFSLVFPCCVFRCREFSLSFGCI